MLKQDAQSFMKLKRKEQEKIKPSIRDIIIHCFDGDMMNNALDFVEHIENKNILIKWGALNSWSAMYKKTCLCEIKLDFDMQTWTISPHLTYLTQYEETITDENMQHIISDNMFICTLYPNRVYNGLGCNPSKKCPGGTDVTIIGKDIKGKCRHRPYPFINNPNETMINYIKKLLELEREAREKT